MTRERDNRATRAGRRGIATWVAAILALLAFASVPAGAGHNPDLIPNAPGAEFRGDALGDVIISVDTAARQARERGVSLGAELRDLLIHGILHLLGMDHERDSDARHMRSLEDHLRWTLARLD